MKFGECSFFEHLKDGRINITGTMLFLTHFICHWMLTLQKILVKLCYME